MRLVESRDKAFRYFPQITQNGSSTDGTKLNFNNADCSKFFYRWNKTEF